jgi:hypothetical protein
MQAVCVPEGKTYDDFQDQSKSNKKELLYFSLAETLPAGHILVLNTALGTLSYLSKGVDRPRLEIQQQFTTSEVSLLRPLLELYPHYCPYEVMFASFYNGTISDETVEHCRQQLYKALEGGIWDQQLRPLRNVLSRTRIKLRPFGIDISSILETGYILMITPSPESREIA